MKRSAIILLFLFLVYFSFAQKTSSYYRQIEDSLKMLSNVFVSAAPDSIKQKNNLLFIKLFFTTLQDHKAAHYGFDSLTKHISILTSSNKNLRVVSWALSFADNKLNYYCIIHHYISKTKKSNTYFFSTLTSSTSLQDDQQYNIHNWPGTLYYKLVESKKTNKESYTLLGWNGSNATSTIKLIDILTFNQNNEPLFGDTIFKNLQNNPYRVLFEYSKDAVMALKYEKQSYQLDSKTQKGKIIVLDHLEPINSNYVGNYSYYVPVGNIVDGFAFYKGYWYFISDVNAKNPANKGKTAKKPSL